MVDARVAVAGGLGDQVELDQRGGLLALQARQQAHLAGDVRFDVDDLVLDPELGQGLAGVLETLQRGLQILLRVAGAVGAGDVRQGVDHPAAFGKHRLGDGAGVLRGERAGRHLHQVGGGIVGDVDHPRPVVRQLLDGAVGGQGEDRVLVARDAEDFPQVDLVHHAADHVGAVHEFVEDVRIGARGAAAGTGKARADPAQDVGRRGGDVLGPHGESHGGGILIRGPGVEVSRNETDRHHHHQHEGDAQPVMAPLHPRGPRDGADEGGAFLDGQDRVVEFPAQA